MTSSLWVLVCINARTSIALMMCQALFQDLYMSTQGKVTQIKYLPKITQGLPATESRRGSQLPADLVVFSEKQVGGEESGTTHIGKCSSSVFPIMSWPSCWLPWGPLWQSQAGLISRIQQKDLERPRLQGWTEPGTGEHPALTPRCYPALLWLKYLELQRKQNMKQKTRPGSQGHCTYYQSKWK